MENKMPDNECGGCTACCTVMPIVSEDFCKQAGKTCEHCLPGVGCGIYEKRPKACQVFLCGWRFDPWLGSRPEYRPDRLGVMFSKDAEGNMSVWEVTPGALDDPRVNYIVNRIKGRCNPGMGVRRYPRGVIDNDVLDLKYMDQRGIYKAPEGGWYWKPLGNKDYIATKEDGHA